MKLIAFFLLLSFSLSAQTGKLSKYVSAKEAYGTNRNIPNVPTKEQEAAIKYVCVNYFDKLRELAGSPLYISSMFRSIALNKAVGGAKYSDHQVLKDSKGYYTVAADIDQDGRGKVGNRALFFVAMHKVTYYKLIFEFGDPVKGPAWVHISWSTDPEKNKLKRVYRAVKRGNKTVYLNFSTSGI
jgi:zinc D-Ala-D-Ala carboxypeptidase